MTKWMTGTADEYIEQFKIWTADSGVCQDGQLIKWFHQGLPAPLRNRILNTNNKPTTIGGWYAYASKFDNQWHHANTISKRLKGVPEKKGLKFRNSGFKFTPKNPNTMDVDRLIIKQRTKYMKKGLCFKCHQFRHRANECGQSTSTSKPVSTPPAYSLPKYKKANDTYTRIKAIYHELPEEEQKKLTDKLEGSGF